MSILSDCELLLNHVKNSFIFGDDTGICELIIEKDFPPNFNIQDILNNELNYPIVDTNIHNFRSSSPEIPVNSNKATIRNLTSDIKSKEIDANESKPILNHQVLDINEWPRVLSDQDINELFDNTKTYQSQKSNSSLLSKLLEETNNADIVSANIFAQYAKFSAFRYMKSPVPNSKEMITKQILVCENDFNKPMRDFNIYFWDFVEQRNRSNPIVIRPVLETKVSELIGLACWKYVEENRYPSLTNPLIVNRMQLYMFEDMEDLDFGFGSLNANDPIYKYKFSHLAILESQLNGRSKFVSICSNVSNNSFVTRSYIEKMGLQTQSIIEIESIPDRHSISNSSDIGEDSILVQIQLAHGLSKFRFTPDTTVEQIIQHTVTKRQLLQHGENYKYRLELASEPGKEIGLNLTLGQIENSSFVLVRDLSRRKPAIPDLLNEETSHVLSEMMDCMQPQYYNVQLKQPLKRWDAILSVSHDFVEIAVSVKVPFPIKPKSIRIPFAFMADSEINFHGQAQSNPNNKVTIKFIHLRKKSSIARNMKDSLEFDYSVIDSETNSVKSHVRYDPISQIQDLSMNNLLSELTSHSISCQSSIGNLIWNQTISIMDFKNHTVRKEYLSLLK